MKGVVSFHPVDLELFDATLMPLVVGRKIDPDPFLGRALALRAHWARARSYLFGLDELLLAAEPPQPRASRGLLGNLRAQLERLDYREDPLVRKVREAIEPELHLHGRPFLITEGSAARVAERVVEYVEASSGDAVQSLILEQLIHIDPQLAKTLEPCERSLSADLSYRSDLLAELKRLYDLAQAARRKESWAAGDGSRRPAGEALPTELPWRAVLLHSRVVPFWIGRHVDGLETVCRSAGVEPPEFLVPPWRLFAPVFEEFPELKAALKVELGQRHDVGGFVAPQDLPTLLDFLNAQGARIIKAAAQHGEGPACTTLLRKIRECATFAERRGLGYLEAAGILPPDLEDTEDSDEPA